MTQSMTSRTVPRETGLQEADRGPRPRQVQRLAALVLLGLTAAGCAGPGTTQQAQMDDTPFWHEEPQED